MLKIEDVHVEVEGKEILKGVHLMVAPGEIHALMGPNGVGKSTLAKVIGGDPSYVVTRGSITFEGEEIGGLMPEERAHRGLFWSFQDPLEIPGLTNTHFLHVALNAQRKARGEEALSEEAFRTVLEEKRALLEVDPIRLERGLNDGFSGGEKKRNEILQLALFEPKLAVLDEIDSGLDVDALKLMCRSLKGVQGAGQSYLFITHYTRLLELIEPHYVHILMDGKIVRTGGPELAHALEAEGYDSLMQPAEGGV